MGRPRKERKQWDELGRLWEVSDDLWAQIAPVLAEVGPPKGRGRPRIDPSHGRAGIAFNRLSPLTAAPCNGGARVIRWCQAGANCRLRSSLFRRHRVHDGIEHH
jgi:hypothetical protein